MRSGFDLTSFLALVGVIYVPMLFSLCFHELAHGLVAKWRGDNTAKMMGRLTMNPIAHADMVGTFVLPLIALATGINWLFGWAKPVPVNTRNLKNPRVDMFWIALAGPLSNVLLAVLATGVLAIANKTLITTGYHTATLKFVQFFIACNLNLAFFNLIPLHPLDGGKVLARFLPAKMNDWLEQNESILSMLLLVLMIGGFLQVMWNPGMPLREALSFLLNLAL